MYSFLLSLLAAPAAAWWWSAGLGVGIGLLYSAASFVATWFAMRQDQRLFMVIVLGGMMARMATALVVVVLILLLLPVEPPVFIGSFLGVFIVGMIVEVWRLHRRMSAPRKP